jgi:transcription initiation factor TFIIE subunit alpha
VNLHRLVKLAARAFYDDLTSKGDNQPKTGRSDNRGIAVVVLDALTRFNLSDANSFINQQIMHKFKFKSYHMIVECSLLVISDSSVEINSYIQLQRKENKNLIITKETDITKEGKQK